MACDAVRVRRLRPSPRGLVAGAVAAPWLVWAVVRVPGLERGHPLVAMIAFTPYAAATAPLPVLVALALRRRAVAAVAAVAALALAAVVLPRALDGPADAPASARGPVLVVMTSNLYVGRADAAAVVRLARERHVDVLSLQELRPEALARLDAAGMRELLPGRVVGEDAEVLTSGVMARRPLRHVPGSGLLEPEAALRVPGAPPLRVKAVHPRPPVSEAQERDWRRSLRALPGPRAGAALRILAG